MKQSVFFSLFIFLLIGTGFSTNDYLATNLKITIRNDLGNLESGVTVILYSSKEDFKKEENPVKQGANQ